MSVNSVGYRWYNFVVVGIVDVVGFGVHQAFTVFTVFVDVITTAGIGAPIMLFNTDLIVDSRDLMLVVREI